MINSSISSGQSSYLGNGFGYFHTQQSAVHQQFMKLLEESMSYGYRAHAQNTAAKELSKLKPQDLKKFLNENLANLNKNLGASDSSNIVEAITGDLESFFSKETISSIQGINFSGLTSGSSLEAIATTAAAPTDIYNVSVLGSGEVSLAPLISS